MAEQSSSLLRKNILISILLVLFVFVLIVAVPGYKWAIVEMAFKNKTKMDEMEARRINYNMDELTLDNKRMFKISNYWFIQYMRDVTPMSDSTVILLPPKSVVDSLEDWREIANTELMEYYVYPRLVVSEDEKITKQALYKRITHVAVVNGWGLDKLSYSPNSQEPFEVFPIQPRKLKNATSDSSSNSMKPFRFQSSKELTQPERY